MHNLEHFDKINYIDIFSLYELEELCNRLHKSSNFSKHDIPASVHCTPSSIPIPPPSVSPDYKDVYNRLGEASIEINRKHFNYDIRGNTYIRLFFESNEMQNVNLYDWNVSAPTSDISNDKKITVIVPLSDSNNYSGGELEVCLDQGKNSIIKVKQHPGTGIFFPSTASFRFTPVTSGQKRILFFECTGLS